jgi:hypothetical protein
MIKAILRSLLGLLLVAVLYDSVVRSLPLAIVDRRQIDIVDEAVPHVRERRVYFRVSAHTKAYVQRMYCV